MGQMNGKRGCAGTAHATGRQRSGCVRAAFGVRAGAWKPPAWLKGLPLCPALGQHQILHMGVARVSGAIDFAGAGGDARPPTGQTSCFVACLSGEGRLGVDGRWYRCSAGTAYFVPGSRMGGMVPGMSGKSWEFCWVCRLERSESEYMRGPVEMAWFDPLPLRYAIEGLACECKGEAVPKDIQYWADLIDSYVMRIARRGPEHQSLTALWERVSADLDADWNLPRLAREAGYSCGHLGRLCRRAFGRSPMHQVTWLRMRRAAEMLATTNLTVEAVAQQVGYANPFVFSNAFMRWVGWRPSDYRRKNNKQFTSR